jgi:hypothetical protein
MGKFLRDKDGHLVNINGGLVLEKILDRKPRNCEQCGFHKWVKKDKIFIIQRNGLEVPVAGTKNNNETMEPLPFDGTGGGGGGMEWICPDCALRRGLPSEHYHKNYYATPAPEALWILQQQQQQQQRSSSQTTTSPRSCDAGWNLLDLTRFMCSSTNGGG